MSAALVLLLALSPAARAPDIQVEAGTAAGVELPELAEAVARALVASGARVLLGGPTNEPCPRCARVAVTDLGQGHCRIDVTQEARTASTALSLGANIPLLDRARAIAIQTRLLVRGEAVARVPENPARPSPRKEAARPVPVTPKVVGSAIANLPPADARPAFEPPREPVASTLGPSPATPPQPVRPTEATTPTAVPKTAPTLAERSPPVRRQAGEEKRQPVASEPMVAARLEKTGPAAARWPWIPFTVGVGAAVGATLFALAAHERHDELSDKSRPYSQAVLLKQQGENWQTAAFIAGGVAVAGLGVGIWGFATSGPATRTVTPTVAVIPGGAMLALSGGLP